MRAVAAFAVKESGDDAGPVTQCDPFPHHSAIEFPSRATAEATIASLNRPAVIELDLGYCPGYQETAWERSKGEKISEKNADTRRVGETQHAKNGATVSYEEH